MANYFPGLSRALTIAPTSATTVQGNAEQIQGSNLSVIGRQASLPAKFSQGSTISLSKLAGSAKAQSVLAKHHSKAALELAKAHSDMYKTRLSHSLGMRKIQSDVHKATTDYAMKISEIGLVDTMQEKRLDGWSEHIGAVSGIF